MNRQNYKQSLRGDIKNLVYELRKNIEDILLHITVNIDYPEYLDELQVTNNLCIDETSKLIDKLEYIIENAETNRVYKEGIKTVILGKPNVGKSSLLNSLLNENKAIVTDISGTTRDIVEGEININGIILHLIDTAGIRNTEDPIEKIGIEKSKEKLDEAELVLLVLDESNELTKEDKELLELTKNKTRLIIGNKVDIGNKANIDEKTVQISSKTGYGIEALKKEIFSMFVKQDIAKSSDLIISSSRHISILRKTLSSLKSANISARNNEFVDMVEIDLKEAYKTLGEIIGESSPDELLDELFNKFCLGK